MFRIIAVIVKSTSLFCHECALGLIPSILTSMKWLARVGRVGGWAGLVGGICLLLSAVAWAQPAQDMPQAGCAGASFYSALFSGGTGSYELYARLSKPGERGEAKVVAQDEGGVCTTLGSVRASGDAWTYVGNWQAPVGQGHLTQFTLESSVFQGLLEANRPMLMLVPQSSPVCRPTDECRVTVQGQSGVIRPAAARIQGDTLRLVEVRDPAADKLQGVSYYVDNELAYSKSHLEAFDSHYVGPGEHTLQRVLHYASGQQVLLRDTIDRGYGDQLLNALLFSFIYGRKTALQLVVGVLLACLLWWLLMLSVHWLYRRHLWKVTHFVRRSSRARTGPLPPEPPHFTRPDSLLVGLLKYMLPAGLVLSLAIVALVALGRYVVQVYQVSGPSMENTLHHGDVVAINRWSISWAKLTSKSVRPGRGDVVLVQPVSAVASLMNDPRETLIKRIIGLPGERVTIAGNKVTVYNTEHPQGFDPDAGSDWQPTMKPGDANALPGFLQSVDITIGPGEVFVMGDNRSQSTDSRVFGTVDVDTLRGRAFMTVNDRRIL